MDETTRERVFTHCDDYQAYEWERAGPHIKDERRTEYHPLGLFEEAGETIAHIKKMVYHRRVLDSEAFATEIGDALWYVAMAAQYIHEPLSVLVGHERFDDLQTEATLAWHHEDPERVAYRLTEAVAHVVLYVGEHYLRGEALQVAGYATRLGQVAYELARCALVGKVQLSDCVEAHLTKLRRRYPDGFSFAAAAARADETATPQKGTEP